jgi:tetratricopeptide (TPR) repeat protein
MLAKRREERPSLVAVRQALLASLAPPTERARPDVVLQPPPRVEALVAPGAPPAAGAAAGAARSRPARASAAPAVALFAGLGLAALAVFVLLPRWVASRPRPAVVAASAPAPPTVAPAPASPPETREPDPPTDATAEPRLTPAPPAREDRRAAPEPPPPAADPAEDRWSAAISEGLAALDRGEFASAKAAFASAEAARPGTPSVADGLARAEEGLKTQALASHRAAALVAEAREDWRTAVGEYDAALRIDPQVAFAVSGRERSGARAELDARLQGYLQRPDRLSAEAVAREAEEALDRAREASPAGQRLAQQIASLEVRLKEAHTPVDVRLESDGLTEVSVLRVGSLGTFREKSIPLKPGSYVVVGKRPGYRDARRTLVVAPGKSPEPLRVRCDEVL